VDVATVLVTIDLTEEVLIEAKAAKANLVVAYHPIIFTGLKRLTQKAAGERIVIESIRSGIAIYSPHTALDAALWGMNDWLAQALGKGVVAPIVPQTAAPAGTGMGRTVELEQPRTLEELVATIKQHLGVTQLRVAEASQHTSGAPIQSAAVCAGAGGSVFKHVESVDLLLTGEMRHHDILARVAAGTSVILADHTNTERGYLPHLAKWLGDALGGDVNVIVSSADSEPLKIV
jgi:dinuclear metal center YbgI/SA1388 family protein